MLCNPLPKGCPAAGKAMRPLLPPATPAAFCMWRGWFYYSNFLVLQSSAGEKCCSNIICALAPEPTCGFACGSCLSDALAGEMKGFISPEDGCEAICMQPSECLPSLELLACEQHFLQQG